MKVISEFISSYYIEIILGLLGSVLILIVLYMVNLYKISKITDRYNRFIRGLKGVNIEELLIHTDEEIKDIRKDINFIEENIGSIKTRLSFAIQKVGFIRYNAFGDMGSDLSFSIALLDNFLNGFVITSIYGKESSVSYGKPIKDGDSRIPLSAEELIAIDRAIKGEALEISFKQEMDKRK